MRRTGTRGFDVLVKAPDDARRGRPSRSDVPDGEPLRVDRPDCRDLIDREYARPLDVAALSRAALMSTAHFSRQFRAAYGETPYAYLMTRRIERAKALLRGGDMSVTEVCMAVGCTSLGSFSARFTQLVGETPTAYRAHDHSALESVPGCVAKDITRPGSRTEQDRRNARDAGPLALRA